MKKESGILKKNKRLSNTSDDEDNEANITDHNCICPGIV